MFKKFKIKKLKDYESNNKFTENPIEKQSDFDITISTENNISKIVISDYISIGDYIKKSESSDEFHLLNLLSIIVSNKTGAV